MRKECASLPTPWAFSLSHLSSKLGWSIQISPCCVGGKAFHRPGKLGYSSFHSDYLHALKNKTKPSVNRLSALGTFAQSAWTDRCGPQVHIPMWTWANAGQD